MSAKAAAPKLSRKKKSAPKRAVSPSGERSRHWCFTIHQTNTPMLKLFGDLKATYLCYAEEKGDKTQKDHLQGYCEFKDPERLSALKKVNKQIHWEVRKGTQKQAIDYCKKVPPYKGPPNDIFYEFGAKAAGQGKRSDLTAMQERIKAGDTLLDLCEVNFASVAKHHKFFEKYAQLLKEKRTWQTEVIVCWGPTGTGKSHYAYLTKQASSVNYVGSFFHGIEQGCPDVICFDDFSPDQMPRELFLKITDKYSMTVNIKGGSAVWTPKTIIFTSNHDPAMWYARDNTPDAAVQRRIHHIKHMTVRFEESIGAALKGPNPSAKAAAAVLAPSTPNNAPIGIEPGAQPMDFDDYHSDGFPAWSPSAFEDDIASFNAMSKAADEERKRNEKILKHSSPLEEYDDQPGSSYEKGTRNTAQSPIKKRRLAPPRKLSPSRTDGSQPSASSSSTSTGPPTQQCMTCKTWHDILHVMGHEQWCQNCFDKWRTAQFQQ